MVKQEKIKKISNLLNEAGDSKFITKNLNFVNDQSNANYDAENEIIYNTKILKPNLCDYSNAYILVRGDFTIAGDSGAKVVFKHYALLIDCISKIDGTIVDDAEDFDVVMLMYNLL